MPRPKKNTEQIAKLDRSFWDNISTNAKLGMNPLVHLIKYLDRLFPGFEFGFFTKEDLEDRRSLEGYVVLTTAHWNAVEQWNENVAERYALSEKNGALCWKELYICTRPIDFGDKRRKVIFDQSESRFQAAKTGTPFRIQERAAAGVGVGAVSNETASAVDPEKFTESDMDEGTEALYHSKRS